MINTYEEGTRVVIKGEVLGVLEEDVPSEAAAR